jgi:uncharacterized membrane protein
LDQGNFPDVVKERLVRRGVDKTTASAVVDDILARFRAAEQEGQGTRLLLRFLGILVFVVGIVLFIGNVTGAFPTFPFAGFIVMSIGGLIWGASKMQ